MPPGNFLNKRCDFVHSGMILSSNFVSFRRHFFWYFILLFVNKYFQDICLKSCYFLLNEKNISNCHDMYEPRRQKTCLRGFRPGPTQTGLDITT